MTAFETLIHERVAQARLGQNPTVISRVRSGWVVLGDQQFFEGYCLLLPDPVVEHLTDLDRLGRSEFLCDMALIGEALLACTDAYRINYDILGNHDAALHAHVFPRFAREPEKLRRGPIWGYDAETRASVLFDPQRHGEIKDALADYLDRRATG